MTNNTNLSTPGQILNEEFMKPLNLDNYDVATAINMPLETIDNIINGKQPITVPLAYRLAKAFSTTPEFWINLQVDYEKQTFDPVQLDYVHVLAED